MVGALDRLILPRGFIIRFTVVGVIIGITLAGGLAWLIETTLMEHVHGQVAARAMDQVELGVLDRLTAADLTPPYTPARFDDLASRIDPLLAQAQQDGAGITRLSLYAPDGTVVYSDRAAQRGRQGPTDSPLFRAALAGSPGRQVLPPTGAQVAGPRARGEDTLELYVPFSLDGRVVGVYEVHQSLASIRLVRPAVWGIALGGFALLFLALLAVSLGAARDIRRQTHELRQRLAEVRALNRQLSSEIDERKRVEAERAELLAREQAARALAEDTGAINAQLVVAAIEAQHRVEALYEAERETYTEAEAARQQTEALLEATRKMEEARRFLAEASSELASSLDFETTLARVARLAVPTLADGCLVDLLDEAQGLRRAAVAHVDPAREELLRDLRRRYPIDPHGPHPVAGVLRTGISDLAAEVSPARIESFVADAEHRALLDALDLRADMIVPLVAHGQTMGTMSFLVTTPGRCYGPADLVVAEGLAYRAALAIDNARLYREAQEAVRLRNEFLGLVVHDLKNPLGAIKDYALLVGYLLAGVDSPKVAKVIDLAQRVDSITTRMVAQINELLDVAHLQIGQTLTLHPGPVDLVALARQKVAEHQRDRSRYRIRLDTELPEIVGVWDGPRLERVLDNLLSNAVKYSRPGSEVIVRLAQEQSAAVPSAVVEVRDSGLGIPAADLPHVWERFYRGSNVIGAIPGSGMGLSGVREIVERHGGTIAVTSEEGKGTTFTVRLPQAADEHPTEERGCPTTVRA